jgi:meso-butanediol dehydrogenase / (S,S)-butanediol dehydrogenase / diacetyl reductase
VDRFSGQVAIITGSGSGIGEAIAARLAAEGAAVCIADRDLEAADRVANDIRVKGGTAQARHVDVIDQATVKAAVDWTKTHLGPIDVLINNAAVCSEAPLGELSETDWDRDVDVVLKGPFLCARAVLPHMIERRSGVVLNIGSVNGSQFLGNDAYSAAKAGLTSLTKSIAVRYGRYGIRANVLAPGTVRTPAWAPRLAGDPHRFDRLARWYPLGRVGTVADIAAAAAFLTSTEASWITGTVLVVDGGLLAGNALMAEDIVSGAGPRGAPLDFGPEARPGGRLEATPGDRLDFGPEAPPGSPLDFGPETT